LKAKSFGPGNALSGARIKRSADTFIEANNMKRVRLNYSNNEIYDEADYEESEDIEENLQADEEEEEEEERMREMSLSQSIGLYSQSQSINKPLKEIRTAVNVNERSWEPSNASAPIFQLQHVNLPMHTGETDHALAPEIDHHDIARDIALTPVKVELQQQPSHAQPKPTEDSFDQFMGWHPKEEWMGINLFTSDLDRHDFGVTGLIAETSPSMQDYNNKMVSSTFNANTQQRLANPANPQQPQINASNLSVPALAQVPLQSQYSQIPQYANVKQELPSNNFANSQKPNNINIIPQNTQEYYANVGVMPPNGMPPNLNGMDMKHQMRPNNNINSVKNNSNYGNKSKNNKGDLDEYDLYNNNGSKNKQNVMNQHLLVNTNPKQPSKWNGGNSSGNSQVKRDRSRSMPSGSRGHGGSSRNSNSRNNGKKIGRSRSSYGRGSDSDSEYLSADNCYDSANTDSESDYETPMQPLPRTGNMSGPMMSDLSHSYNGHPNYHNPHMPHQYQNQNVMGMNIHMGNVGNSYHMNGSYHNSQSHTLSRSSATQKRARLPAHSVSTLKEWFFRHSDNPYPTEEEKEEFTRKLALTLLQVNNWFTNARRRLLPHSRELM